MKGLEVSLEQREGQGAGRGARQGEGAGGGPRTAREVDRFLSLSRGDQSF